MELVLSLNGLPVYISKKLLELAFKLDLFNIGINFIIIFSQKAARTRWEKLYLNYSKFMVAIFLYNLEMLKNR